MSRRLALVLISPRRLVFATSFDTLIVRSTKLTSDAIESGDLAVAQPGEESERVPTRHARFEVRDGEMWVVDLDSINGTSVNDEPIEKEARLQEQPNGDASGVIRRRGLLKRIVIRI
jgi:hypothetical protein